MRFKLLIFCVIVLFGCSTTSSWVTSWIAPVGQVQTANEIPWGEDQEEDSQESESQEEREKEKEEQFNNHFFALQAHYSQLMAYKFHANNLSLPNSIQIEINTPPPKPHA